MAAINRQRKRLLLRMNYKVIRHNVIREFQEKATRFLAHLEPEPKPLKPGDIFYQGENVTVVVDKVDEDRIDLTATVTQKVNSVYMTVKLTDESEEP